MVQFGEYPTEDDISQGGGGLLSGTWRFDSATGAADPGSGRFRLNTGAYGTAVSIFIDDITRDGVDASNFLTLLSSGDRLYIQEVADASAFAVFDVSASVDNVGWFTLTVAVAGSLSGNFLTNNRDCIIALQFGGAGAALPEFSEFEEAAGRAVTTTETDLVTLSGLDFPGVKNGVAEYRVEIDMTYAVSSANNFIRTRLYLGTTGDLGDTEIAQWVVATSTVTGSAHSASHIVTPGASDLIGFSHQTGAGTCTILGAGGADLRTTRVFITRVT